MTRRSAKSSRRSAFALKPPALRLPGVGPLQREMLGGVLVSLSVVTVLAFVSAGGTFTDSWVQALRWLLGWMAPASAALFGGVGAWLILDAMDGRADVRWARPAAALVLFVAATGLLHLLADAVDRQATLRSLAEAGHGGGWAGFAIATALGANFGRVPAGVLLFLVMAGSVTVAAGHTLREGVAFFRDGTADLLQVARRLLFRPGRARRPAPGVAADPPLAAEPQAPARAARRSGAKAQDGAGGAVRSAPAGGVSGSANWHLPAVREILDSAAAPDARAEDAETTARTIEQALAEFGVPARVVKISRGPTVTQYGLEPGYVERAGRRARVKVGRIVALQNDLALALAASPIRIQAPVPGRPYVGVEVPNAAKSDVLLRDVLESDVFQQVAARGSLPIALGRDTSGRPAAADLAAMPHLLIAGTTGSGKSVAMNALICTLLMTHTPDTLKLLLVDPKRVELLQYHGLPHLAAPVVVEIDRTIGVLQWVVREMDRRYKVFAEEGTRNLDAYNRRLAGRGEPALPYLVLFIDELADLMMVAPEESERLITRLAQLARATGIHLVLATQRPSVDVVTGLIKANFPSRIAFAVSSGVDSRVILDSVGAEKLLGRGDMLYQASDSSRLQRLQGCYVSDAEIERLCRYWRWSGHGGKEPDPASLTLGLPAPLIHPDLWAQMLDAPHRHDGSDDPLWSEAVALLQRQRTASTSFLQRKLRIGYSRAARLLDDMEAAGMVGPAQGSAPREVLLPPQAQALEDADGDAGDGGAGSGRQGWDAP